VQRFIYTSSTAAIFTGKNIIDADENVPTVSEDDAKSYYGASKAAGERIVMEANGKNGMYTCAIRPASFTG
jgi:nucleoside-diphosphate-sugar epimerase